MRHRGGKDENSQQWWEVSGKVAPAGRGTQALLSPGESCCCGGEWEADQSSPGRAESPRVSRSSEAQEGQWHRAELPGGAGRARWVVIYSHLRLLKSFSHLMLQINLLELCTLFSVVANP